jgi:hypothetical protein
MSWQISRSRSRLLGLEGGVETKSRFLNLDWDFSIIKTSFLKLLRFSWPLRLTFCQCQDWDHVETNQDPQAYILSEKNFVGFQPSLFRLIFNLYYFNAANFKIKFGKLCFLFYVKGKNNLSISWVLHSDQHFKNSTERRQ